VRSTPIGITCPTDCRQDYALGTVVSLTAEPVAGSIFAGWNGAGCQGTGGCSITVAESVTVTATFQPSALTSVTLTVSRLGEGSGTVASTPAGVTCGDDCSESFPLGRVVTLTAVPAAGSRFVGWAGGPCRGSNPCVLTMSAATAVTATFERLPGLTLSVAVSPPTATTGDTVVGSASADNPGLDGAADFYLGVLLADGETVVFVDTHGDLVFARASDPATFAPVATAVDLATPFSVIAPAVFAHTWTGEEAEGTYLFFLAALRAGSLTDGSLDDGDVLVAASMSFVFSH
jgi:hypothetical protein